uniref:Uncharacterized protein n=1 Tax=Melopsittacus undulatus TaxID=13146 RepID=A0A8V5FUI0_MELUD
MARHCCLPAIWAPYMHPAQGHDWAFTTMVVWRSLEENNFLCTSLCSHSPLVLAVLGFAGGAYCVVISSLGLIGGPLCDTGDGEYLYPFRNDTLEGNYLFNQTTWSICKEPENIILWNIILFSILLAIGVIEAVLCFIQVINGLTGFICGTCMRKRKYRCT